MLPVTKILVVDDSITVSKVFELKLKAAGFEVDTASDGLDALEKMTVKKYDLVLLDLVMPRMNGFEVLEKFKEWGFGGEVIVTSNLSQEEDIKKASEYGVKKLFVKSSNTLPEIIEYIKTTYGNNENA